jgi:hypothetical protein
MPLVSVESAKELRDVARISEGGSVDHFDWRQSAAQVRRGIALGAAGRNRVAKDLTDALLGAVRRLVLAAPLEPPEDVE